MKILIVGGGGREHALAWKCAQSPRVSEVFVAPGNAGTALEPKVRNVDIPADDIDALLEFAVREDIGLTIVGPGRAAGRRHRRSIRGGAARLLRPHPRRGAPGRIESVHQGFPQASSHTDRELRHLHRRRLSIRPTSGAAPARGRQGRRSRGRQGRHHLRDARVGDRRGRTPCSAAVSAPPATPS